MDVDPWKRYADCCTEHREDDGRLALADLIPAPRDAVDGACEGEPSRGPEGLTTTEAPCPASP